MLAVLQANQSGYTARFERHFPHSVEEVWSYLTENEKLAKWFSELRVDDLRAGGIIQFVMPDGTFLELPIIEMSTHSVLEYTWGEDRVRFELYPESESGGCHLILIEMINKLTDHTPKDLAGWHVCLEVIAALLDGKTVESRKEVWKIWHEKYVELIKNFMKNGA
jgi:uncharacterized protein YndB with AHSA1/START domain